MDFTAEELETIRMQLSFRACDLDEEANDLRLDLDQGIAGGGEEDKASHTRRLEQLERELEEVNQVLTKMEGAEFR